MSIGIFMPALLINPEIRVVLPNGHLPVDRMDLLFTPEEWASSTNKRIIVEAGTEVGNNNYGYVLAVSSGAAGQAGSFNGKLVLENSGIISGRGGAANGGVGGDAINANLLGRNGQKLEIINNGIIRSGGGGGGKGGGGGGGSYVATLREPETGEEYKYPGPNISAWLSFSTSGTIQWSGPYVAESVSALRINGSTSYTVGQYTYYKGSFRQKIASGDGHGMWRTSSSTVNSNGGDGGNGGVGQGFGQSASSGSAGANGGTNAGKGGSGGNGGAFGSSGVSGAVGTAGNRTAGSAGSAGGLAGFYIDGQANVTWVSTGTRIGRAR